MRNFTFVFGIVSLMLASAASAANRPTGYATICNEGRFCYLSKPTTVAFGRADRFTYKELSGGFICRESTFGTGTRVAGGKNECSIPKYNPRTQSSSSKASSSKSSSRISSSSSRSSLSSVSSSRSSSSVSSSISSSSRSSSVSSSYSSSHSSSVSSSISSSLSSSKMSSSISSSYSSSVSSSISSSSRSSSVSSSISSSSRSSSSLSSSRSSSSSVAATKSVTIQWSHPTQRENGAYLELHEIGGYEIRVRTSGNSSYTTYRITGNTTTSYTLPAYNSDTSVEIAVFDTAGIYSSFIVVN